MRLFLTTVTFSLALQIAQADTPPIPKERWSGGDAEKTWGIKVKNVHYTPPAAGTRGATGKYDVILEFTKDLMAEELKAVQDGFATPKRIKDDNGKLQFHFFDQDGVVIAKCTSYTSGYQVQGDLTGRKGDAFRIVIMRTFPDVLQPPQDAMAKKVEIRVGAPTKP